MSEHKINIEWSRQGVFSHEGFDRNHQIQFHSDVSLTAAGANNPSAADPEQMLAAALSSCHMQTFLVLASKKRLQVESYSDDAIATLSQRDDGKFYVSKITLNPRVSFTGDKIPDKQTLESMHHKSHDHCFVANSISCEIAINLEP